MKSRHPSKLETISLIRRALRAGFKRTVEVLRLPVSGRFAVLVFLVMHRTDGTGAHFAVSFRGLGKPLAPGRRSSIAITVYHYGESGRPKKASGIQAAFDAVKEMETRAA